MAVPQSPSLGYSYRFQDFKTSKTCISSQTRGHMMPLSFPLFHNSATPPISEPQHSSAPDLQLIHPYFSSSCSFSQCRIDMSYSRFKPQKRSFFCLCISPRRLTTALHSQVKTPKKQERSTGAYALRRHSVGCRVFSRFEVANQRVGGRHILSFLFTGFISFVR